MSARPRVQRKPITLAKKAEILSDVKAGKASKTEIARKHGIAKSTLAGIVKNEARVTAAFSDGEFAPKRKKMRTAAHKDLEDVLLAWIQRARSANLPVNGVVLKAKAEEVALRMDIQFSCSDGWLDRFRKRHGLVFRSIVGESAAVDEATCNDWRLTKLKDLLQEYNPKDIYNVDETAVFYQMLPQKTLALAGDSCTGGKHSKLRITVLVGANMTGTDKLKLLVIGKSKSPRCFKNVKTLPVTYTANAKSWMTQSLFEQWLRDMDRRFMKEKRRVLFLVDNCPGHGQVAGLEAIRVEFLPANTTAKLQPMDQGVISSLKRHYRRSLLQRMLLCLESNKQYVVDLLAAVHLLSNAWNQVTEATIANSFRHAGFVAPDDAPDSPTQDCGSDSEEEAALLSSLGSKGVVVDMDTYVSVDENVETCRADTIDSIIEEVLEVCSEGASDDEEDARPGPVPVSCEAAEACLNSLVDFFQQHEGTERFLTSLGEMASFVSARQFAQKRQTSITDWLKPSKSSN